MEMSDRIRHLEEALGALQSSCSSQTHPLLREDLLLIKTSVKLSGSQTGSSQTPVGPSPFDLPETEAYNSGQGAAMEVTEVHFS